LCGANLRQPRSNARLRSPRIAGPIPQLATANRQLATALPPSGTQLLPSGRVFS